MFGLKNEEILTYLILVIIGYFIAKMFGKTYDGFNVGAPPATMPANSWLRQLDGYDNISPICMRFLSENPGQWKLKQWIDNNNTLKGSHRLCRDANCVASNNIGGSGGIRALTDCCTGDGWVMKDTKTDGSFNGCVSTGFLDSVSDFFR